MAEPSAEAFATPPASQSGRLIFAFVGLCFALSVPFWGLGALWTKPLLPGLPSTALMFICPLAAAAVLAARDGGWRAVARLLRRTLDGGRIRHWLLALVLIATPVVAAILSWIVARLSGAPIPIPDPNLGHAAILAVGLFVAATCEELGWTGWLSSPLIARFGPLGAGLVLGVVCAFFHYVALAQIHRPIEWIAWWSVGTVATRVIMVQLYARAGRSVLAVSLMHLLVNLSWQLFPGDGAWFNPAISGVIMAGLAGVIVLAGHASDKALRARSVIG